MKKIFTLAVTLLMTLAASASLALKGAGGWNESAWMEFTGLSSDYSYYNAYVSSDGTTWQKLDGQLVRSYGSYGRVDALGLKAGSYKLRVVPVKGETEVSGDAVDSGTLEVRSFSRSGYAHYNATAGIGAYNNDGTLKSGARVLYVTAANAKTVSLEMQVESSKYETRTGIQNILQAYEKGVEQRPLAVRIIGTLTENDMDDLGSSAIGLQVKGKSQNMNLTVEGVGFDATLYGFGVLARNCRYVEFRNFAIMLHPEDGMSFDTNNEHIWGHHLDIFYGQNKGGDKAKGDGSFDVKGTLYATVDNVHYWDTGKCNLNSNGDAVDYVTYHHNWFDHSDSRHPRVRVSKHLHVYNNYYDGNAKYGIGSTTGSCIFSERNYFRNCKYPMLISKQGSDINNGVGSSSDTKGTFSSEDGGIIKSFGNYMTGEKRYQPYNASDAVNSIHFDAYEASSRDEKVPETVVTLKGGTGYNNFDTESSFYSYTPTEVQDVPSTVTGTYGAGRCQKGDFGFSFDNAVDDASYDINSALESKLKAYKTSLVAVIGDEQTQVTPEPTPDPDPDPTPDPDPDPDPDPTPVPTPGEDSGICHFTDKKPSLSFVTVSGNYSNSKGSVEYNGVTYSIALKIETKTNIQMKPTVNGKITLIFGGSTSAAGKDIKIDGVKVTLDANGRYTFDVKAGTTYTLTKGDSINLFLIVLEADSTSVDPDPTPEPEPDPTPDPNPTPDPDPDPTPDDPSTAIENVEAGAADAKTINIVDAMGRTVNTPVKGKIYIINRKKYLKR